MDVGLPDTDVRCDRPAPVSLHDEASSGWPGHCLAMPRTRCAAGALLGETFWYTKKYEWQNAAKSEGGRGLDGSK
jgi:hypothetical protein